MTRTNGNGTDTATTLPPTEAVVGAPDTQLPAGQPLELATRAKLRAKTQAQPNKVVILAAGGLVVALLIFVALSMPRNKPTPTPKSGAQSAKGVAAPAATASSDKSLFPIVDSGRPPGQETHPGFLDEQDLERSATRRAASNGTRPGQPGAPGTLGSIPPFGGEQGTWQAPPYQTSGSGAEQPDASKAEREAMEKSSLLYVHSVARSQGNTQGRDALNEMPELSLGLATGTRLRARLESTASTAVRAPVLAVIEYNYERDGEIIVPAGSKAVGHLQEADRSGYVRLQFDTLMLPDGEEVPIQAVGTDLEMRPLKGKVEGKNTGKNVLVRSLSGIGEAGSLLLGRGSLNQPLSESDLIRERMSNNIGEAGDEEVSRLAVTQRIVVTVAADTPIYVVLEQKPKMGATSGQASARSSQSLNMNAEELRQLLQLKRELNQASSTSQ